MFEAINSALLGSVGRAILSFIMENLGIFLSIFLIWAIVITVASINLKNTKKKVESIVLLTADHQKKKTKKIIVRNIYLSVLSEFQKEIAPKVKFIPNKMDLWITFPSSSQLADRIGLSTEMVKQVMIKHKKAFK